MSGASMAVIWHIPPTISVSQTVVTAVFKLYVMWSWIREVNKIRRGQGWTWLHGVTPQEQLQRS